MGSETLEGETIVGINCQGAWGEQFWRNIQWVFYFLKGCRNRNKIVFYVLTSLVSCLNECDKNECAITVNIYRSNFK